MSTKGIEQFTERISNDKGIHENHLSEWKSHVTSSVNEKICTLKNNITCGSVESIFSEPEVKNTEGFVIVPLDKAANNVKVTISAGVIISLRVFIGL